MAPRKPAATSDNDLFMQALIGAALTFAPSVEVLEAETARRMMLLQGVPDVFDAFRTPLELPVKARKVTKANAKPAPKKKSGNRSPLTPTTPITEALAGVRRHGTFEANGIATLKDAAAYSESELTAISGIGPGLLTALKDALSRAGIALRAEEA